MNSRRTKLGLAWATAGIALALVVLAHFTYLGAGLPTLVAATIATVAAAVQFCLIRLTRARHERQLRAMYDSMKEVSSASDVKAVLTTVARRAADALGAADGVIMIRHGDDLRAYSGTKLHVEPVANAIGLRAFASEAELPSVRVLRTAETLAIEDVRDYAGPPGFEDACRFAHIGSVLCVPVMSWNRAAGALNLGFAEPRRFSAADIALANAYADQAASALERSLAYELEIQARRAMKELEDLKSGFISSVGNELQTPLTSISGFSDVLTQHWDEFGEAERRECASKIGRQAKVLSSLVDDLLEMRGLGTGVTGRQEVFDLRLLVLGTLGRLLDDLRNREVVVDVDEGTSVWTRPAAFERVLYNLLTNALKFSPPHTTIAIAARTADDEVIVSVHDRGVGVAPEDRERIFERFYRVESGDTSRGGAGIGLAVAKKLVEAMDGRIWVSSELGRGSTFSFSLRGTPEPEPDVPHPTEVLDAIVDRAPIRLEPSSD
jgi:signal transduction histidine kinase